MPDSFIQLPADSTGKQLDTVAVNMGVGTTSVHREKVVLADPSSTTGFATVTSSAGLLVSLSSGTVTLSSQAGPWSSAPGFNVPVVSVSSGLVQVSGTVTMLSASSGFVQISGIPTVTATGPVTITSGIVTLSSVPTIFSASSGGIQAFIPISPTSSVAGAGFGPVTSSAGVLASLSSGTVTLSSAPTVTATAATNPWSSAPGFNVPVVTVSSGFVQVAGTVTILSASSGLIQISGIPTVTSTSVVLSSAGLTQISGTVTVLSASSGLVQISGVPPITVQGSSGGTVLVTSSGAMSVTISTAAGAASTQVNIQGSTGTVAAVTSSGALLVSGTPGSVSTAINIIGATTGIFAPVTSSFGLLVNSTQPITLTSGTVSLSSQITVTATGPVTITSGLISVTSGTITSTAATNPWSSSPGFNIPTVSVSSGLSQISAVQVSPTSSVAGAGLLVVTSSFGLVTQSTQPVTITSGTVSLSSQITVTATGPVTMTSGTVTLSSAPLVIVASSGGTQTVIMSSIQTVTATAATNPWSSAPGFNVPTVSVSSGLVQTFVAPPVVTSNIVSTYFFSTGGAASVNVRGSASNLLGYSYFNTTATIRGIKVYNTSSAPGIGTTTNVLIPLVAPGSTGGGGANVFLPLPGLFASNGIGFTMTANAAATDTGAPGANDLVLTLYYI